MGTDTEVEGGDDIGRRERHGNLEHPLHLPIWAGDQLHGTSIRGSYRAGDILGVAHEIDF